MKKVLILSTSTGQGHNTAAAAIQEEMEKRGVACDFQDPIALRGERKARFVSNAYISTAVHAPKVFGEMYKVGLSISSSRHKSIIYYANRLYSNALMRYIDAHPVDAIVTPHLFPAEALTFLRKQGLSIPCYAIATDYTCVPFFEETDMDAFFIASPELEKEYIARGIPAEKLIATGIPVRQGCLHKMEKKEARKNLSLPLDAPIALVMGGSMGFGNPESLSRQLCSCLGSEGKIIILSGHNEKLRSRLTHELADILEHFIILPYTDQVPLYMSACDVLLTKPGGLTSTEAAVMNIPMVHTPPIPGCESANIEFFESRGMSASGKDEKTLAQAAARLALSPEAQETMKAAQQRYINPYAARDICDIVLT